MCIHFRQIVPFIHTQTCHSSHPFVIDVRWFIQLSKWWNRTHNAPNDRWGWGCSSCQPWNMRLLIKFSNLLRMSPCRGHQVGVTHKTRISTQKTQELKKRNASKIVLFQIVIQNATKKKFQSAFNWVIQNTKRIIPGDHFGFQRIQFCMTLKIGASCVLLLWKHVEAWIVHRTSCHLMIASKTLCFFCHQQLAACWCCDNCCHCHCCFCCCRQWKCLCWCQCKFWHFSAITNDHANAVTARLN